MISRLQITWSSEWFCPAMLSKTELTNHDSRFSSIDATLDYIEFQGVQLAILEQTVQYRFKISWYYGQFSKIYE